jgi:hypothetical protein
MTSNRLAGHELWSEGKPIEGRNRYASPREGRGECSCGALSPTLPSNAKRKQWHRDHKADIRAAGVGKVGAR